jgi:hypothetical protein
MAICDYNYLRHPGWQESNACISKLFSPQTVRTISKKITELTKGIDPKGRNIIVPDETICSVLDAEFRAFRPPTGDIFTRYIIPNDQQADMVQSIIDQTIEIIYSQISGELGMDQANEKLSAWVQVMGDFNTHGLRQFPPIKTLKKRPSTMQFQMNY